MRVSLLVLIITLILFSCSKGYIEVQNKTATKIEDVKAGDNITFGTIESGSHKDLETKELGKHYITFTQNGIRYRSKWQVEIDAETSATFIYKDSNDVVVVE